MRKLAFRSEWRLSGAKRTFKRKRHLVTDWECVEDDRVSDKLRKC
jgi:hypothetical protein